MLKLTRIWTRQSKINKNKPGDSILWALPVFGTANRKTILLENKKKILYLENNSNNNIIPTKKPSVKQKLRNFGWNDIAQILPDHWTVWKRLQWLTYAWVLKNKTETFLIIFLNYLIFFWHTVSSGALIDMTIFQKTTTFSFTGDFVCVRVWTGSMN